MKKLPKTVVMEKIEQEHRRLLELLAGMDREEMLAPGVISTPNPGQSIKDILAHLSAWEQRMQVQIRAISQNTEFPQYPNTADFNAQVYAANKDRTVEDVLAGFERCYQDTVFQIQQLTEAEFDTDRVWQLVGYNTYRHYAWASKEIKRWKKNRAGD